MTTSDTPIAHVSVSHRTPRTVDLAGTAWPLYKLEAVAVGLLVFVAVLAVTETAQVAVLTAAAVAVVVWWVRRLFPDAPPE
ncbi:hypothetical protein [Rhodococcus tibetensis]|uniref:Uncharacterized protein n=1 Tax=Rhodococcus tibetensis TaxID=2965064 RepID=A0ABT1QBH2_9NOCA|nr:hypothetical protein [Rhodococcus sp. FXJ9.536]MCQ4119070.1 hypothetical protein [Rhodococcus sp. FXJ9.536]